MKGNAKRVIARVDVKGQRLIKGIHLEGWRFLPGEPLDYCRKYYADGIDEIIYIDAVASLYNRDSLKNLIESYTADVFIPITVGGGIRTVDDAYNILRCGADKIAINSQAVKTPGIIDELATRFGSQCVVASIQAKWNNTSDKYEVWYDTARERTEIDVLDWAIELESRGAGELLVTAIDEEGTLKGMDVELIKLMTAKLNIPLIASGGFGRASDFVDAAFAGADAVAIAKALHYNHLKVEDVKLLAKEKGLEVRT